MIYGVILGIAAALFVEFLCGPVDPVVAIVFAGVIGALSCPGD